MEDEMMNKLKRMDPLENLMKLWTLVPPKTYIGDEEQILHSIL